MIFTTVQACYISITTLIRSMFSTIFRQNEETRLKRAVSCSYGQAPYVNGCDGKIILFNY